MPPLHALMTATVFAFSEAMIPILFFGGVGVLIVGGIVLSIYFNRKRREAWQRVAGELGFDYTQTDHSMDNRYPAFKLFKQGRSRVGKNIISGEAQGTAVAVCDYQYTTGSGKNQSTHHQTICILESEMLDVPHFFVRKQHRFLDMLGSWFGGQDIDFDEDPDFSGAFVLQGENEQAVRELFGPALRQYFVQNLDPRMTVEGTGPRILINFGSRQKPDTAQEILQKAFAILGECASAGSDET